MDEKERRGLCYFCDEKYSKSDTWVAQNLYLIDGIGPLEEEPVSDDEIKEKEDASQEEEEQIPEIVVHVIAGILTL